MTPIITLVALFVAVPVVVTPAVAVSDVKNDNHHNFRALCVLAEGKFDPQMLGSCEGGQWLNVYKNLYEAKPTNKEN